MAGVTASSLANLIAAASGGILLVIYRKRIEDALSRFNRRGPRPPTGPLPADDAFILRRKRARVSADPQ